MGGWLARLVISLFVLASITASAANNPTVLTATAGTDGSDITRFTLRFSEPMAPLGRGSAPMTMECEVDGAGRWVDPATFVWEFVRPLPGGITCTAELRDRLQSLSGRDVVGTRVFPIDSGGPFARAILPYDGSTIEE